MFVLRDSESASQNDDESSDEEDPQNENDPTSKGGTISVKRYKANCQNKFASLTNCISVFRLLISILFPSLLCKIGTHIKAIFCFLYIFALSKF